jgi:hypothetical protein
LDGVVFVVGEVVPKGMDSPEGGSHEGVPDQWRTHEYGNLHVCNNLFMIERKKKLCPTPPLIDGPQEGGKHYQHS